jgi:hypothetical protein
MMKESAVKTILRTVLASLAQTSPIKVRAFQAASLSVTSARTLDLGTQEMIGSGGCQYLANPQTSPDKAQNANSGGVTGPPYDQ